MEKQCRGCMRMKTQSPLCEHCGYNENIDNRPHQLPIDTLLADRYRVGKALGQGGFGISYIGWDEKRGCRVAVKEYYPNGVAIRDAARSLAVRPREEKDKDFFNRNRELFLNEARSLLQFGKVPQIVHVQNVFEMHNTVYIAMEYLEGVDLRRHLQLQGVMTAEQTLLILRPVIRALGRVHSTGIVHRDISPDNIMLLPDGSAKLLDFGAAGKFTGEDSTGEAGAAILKHGFAPPEQYKRNGNLGPWTDVYALCATVYYCLTGKIPLSAPKRKENGGGPLGWAQIPGLTAEQAAVLEQGMALELQDRFPDVETLYAQLYAGMPEEIPPSRQEQTAAAAPPVKPVRERKPLNPKIIAALAVLVLCVGAAAAAVKLLSIPRGWKEEDGIRCYYEAGVRVTGLRVIDGDTFCFDEAGGLCTGWQLLPEGSYYFAEDGTMVTGSAVVDGTECLFGEDGRFVSRHRSLTGSELTGVLSEDRASYTGTNGKTQKSEYQLLNTPVENCVGLTVELKLTEFKHGNVDEWCFYYRDLSGVWHSVGPVFSLEDNGALRSIDFDSPVSFDAYGCFCLSLGSMWNFETECALTAAEIIEYGS